MVKWSAESNTPLPKRAVSIFSLIRTHFSCHFSMDTSSHFAFSNWNIKGISLSLMLLGLGVLFFLCMARKRSLQKILETAFYVLFLETKREEKTKTRQNLDLTNLGAQAISYKTLNGNSIISSWFSNNFYLMLFI